MTGEPLHNRLPQRADAVEGKEQLPEESVPAQVIPDARPAAPPPVRKAGKLSRAENGIIAELDQGPLGA